jgi:pyruvate formate lyase activating enzyme
MDSLMSLASPEQIAHRSKALGCKSVAYTYNDPVIFHEYAIDTALACRDLGILSVAVSAGYVCQKPREEFYAVMDAVNIDLKSFSEDFYFGTTGAHLKYVLDTLLYIRHETNVWLKFPRY